MAAPKGNEFWKLRSVSGPPKKFNTPEELEAVCNDYFEARSQETWNKVKVPYTQASLCAFIGITQETWMKWRREREDLTAVITRVDELIRDQKFTGAVVGVYNHNIIARDLGLADQKNVTGDINYTEVKRTVVRPGNSDG